MRDDEWDEDEAPLETAVVLITGIMFGCAICAVIWLFWG
jgi:hypothetical protein